MEIKRELAMALEDLSDISYSLRVIGRGKYDTIRALIEKSNKVETLKTESFPAFPCPSPNGTETYSGITIREHFAITALSGLIASGWGGSTIEVNRAVELSVIAADDLIKKLSK
jgi:hypothetical protein